MTPTLFEVEGPKMKWFQLDSDTPVDPKFARLLQDGLSEAKGGTDAHAAFGAAMLLCCFVADHGRGAPGHGVDKNGEPLDLDDMAFATRFKQQAQLVAFLDELAGLRLIDRARWESDRVVVFPAMFNRADEYSRRKWGTVEVGPDGSGVVGTMSGGLSTRAAKVEKGRPTVQDKTSQDSTKRGSGGPLVASVLFARFWAAYPDGFRVAKQKALKAWRDAGIDGRLDGELFVTETILPALARAKASRLWRDGIGIPHPSSWLNGRRWEDESAAEIARPVRAAAPVARRAGAGARAGKYSGLGD